jgi:hypothetical protein
MQGIHQGKRCRFRQRRIDNIFITRHGKQGTDTKAKAGINSIRMNKKTDIRYQEARYIPRNIFQNNPAASRLMPSLTLNELYSVCGFTKSSSPKAVS